MPLCSCDGPPHIYDPSWCRPKLGRTAIETFLNPAAVPTRERSEDRGLLDAVRALHRRLGRPSIAECTCGLIVCPTLRVLEGG